MEKPQQTLDAVAEHYLIAAEYICAYIHDPKEKKAQLDELRTAVFEHAKMNQHFQVQRRAVDFVAFKLKEIKDLELRKEYQSQLTSLKETQDDDLIRSNSILYQSFEESIGTGSSGSTMMPDDPEVYQKIITIEKNSKKVRENFVRVSNQVNNGVVQIFS